MERGKVLEVISNSYRIAHSHNLHLWSFLAVTGGTLMAIELFSPLAYLAGLPLAPLLGVDPVTAGVQLLRVLHRVFGVIWGLLLIVYGCFLVCFGKLEVLKPLRKPLKEQIAEAKALAGMYLLGRPLPKEVEEKLDRHNVFVAYLAVLLAISFILLAASGVGLMFRYSLGLSAEQAALLLLLHDLGFGLSMLFVLLHLYAAFHPANRPLLDAMFSDGRVPLEWAEKHMPAFLRRRGILR
jgi:formate dehydrogenase subunit gamma